MQTGHLCDRNTAGRKACILKMTLCVFQRHSKIELTNQQRQLRTHPGTHTLSR